MRVRTSACVHIVLLSEGRVGLEEGWGGPYAYRARLTFCSVSEEAESKLEKETETRRGRLLAACGRRVERGEWEGERRGTKTISSPLLLL